MAEFHPGSMVGDSIEEFKKLPTWGKALAGVAIVGVAYLAIRARNAASTTNAPQPMTGTDTTSPTQQSPFPMVGNLPVLPSNVNPLTDNSGNVIGFQQNPVTTPTPTPQAPASNNPFIALLPAGTTGVPTKAGASYTYNGQQFTIVPGPNRIWGVYGNVPLKQAQNTPIAPGQKVLLQGVYPGATSGGTGGGPVVRSMLASMLNPDVYFQNMTPHTTSA